jgi:hypothetical protein
MHLSPATTDANLPANNLSQLLALHDQAFIHAAYQKLLGRHPDPEGLSYYLGRLRNGIPKMQILTQLRLSTESKAHTIDLPGLDVAIQRYQRGQLPLIGWLFRQIYGTEGNTAIERKLRSIENKIVLLSDESNRRFNQTETALAGLPHLVTHQTQTIIAAISAATTTLTNAVNQPPPDAILKPSGETQHSITDLNVIEQFQPGTVGDSVANSENSLKTRLLREVQSWKIRSHIDA